jgi:hypothetical protein
VNPVANLYLGKHLACFRTICLPQDLSAACAVRRPMAPTDTVVLCSGVVPTVLTYEDGEIVKIVKIC